MACPKRECLDRRRSELLQSINADELFLKLLVAKKVLRNDQSLDLKEMDAPRRINTILDIVRKNPNSYPFFLEALQESNQQHSHSLLTPPTQHDNLSSGLERLKDYYRRRYRRTQSFFSSASMDMKKDYIKTDLTKIKQRANNTRFGEQIDENDIFDGSVKQILIDGKGGSGKTTLVYRYAWQWAEQNGSEDINNLAMVICYTGSSIDQHGIDIAGFLSRFDSSNGLYDFYKENQDVCLVIFEAMDEASEKAKKSVCEFLKRSTQPMIITTRIGDFPQVERLIKKHLRRNTFSEEQALQYLRCSFPKVAKQIKDMLVAETIDAKLLQSPYNCQSLGELLMQDINNADTDFEDGLKLTTTVLFSKQIAQLRRTLPSVNETFFQNLAKLALWSTVQDQQRFTKKDLERYQIKDCKALESFMVKGVCKAEEIYIFQHQLIKDYLAAIPISELDSARRDDFYRVLCSKKKHVAVVRFVCGLLDKDCVKLNDDFRYVLAHMKLVGEIKQLQSKERETVLRVSSENVRAILGQHHDATMSQTYVPTSAEAESLVAYALECDRFTTGNMSNDEVLTLLDGDNGRSCFSWPTLYMLKDFYLCLDELPVANKEEFDIVQQLIGNGLKKEDPVAGKMLVYPCEDKKRWGQMLIHEQNEKEELWVLAHTMADARHALKNVPTDVDPHVLGVAIPSTFSRMVWGCSEGTSLKYFFQRFFHREKKRLENLYVWVETPLQLKGALPNCLENVRLSVCPYQENSVEIWDESLDYLVSQRIGKLEVSYFDINMDNDGFLKALSSKSHGEVRVTEFRALDGTIKQKDATHICQLLRRQIPFFRFDRTVISEVSSVPDLITLMNQDMVIAVSVQQSKDLKLTEDECNMAIKAKWSTTEPTENITKLYVDVLQTTTFLGGGEYELPTCRLKENVDNMKKLIEEVLFEFKQLPREEDRLTLTIKIRVPETKPVIIEIALKENIPIRWSRNENFDVAKLSI